jgi:heat shock protein HslJ
MKKLFPVFLVITLFASCDTAKQSTTTSDSIVGKHWRLVELNSAVIQHSQLNKEAHMVLNAAEKRITGSGGCNSFFGGYELQGSSGISFSNMGATKMACPDNVMRVEQQLFEAFGNANQFVVRNDTLLLAKSGGSPLAKFIVTDRK